MEFFLPDKFDSVHHLNNLLDLLKKGDEKSKIQIVEFSFKRFKKLAKRMIASYPLLRTKADTDDLLQNFIIRLTKAIESIVPNNSIDFFQLASVLMRNELIDMGRKLFGKDGAKKNFEQPTSSLAFKPTHCAAGFQLARRRLRHPSVCEVPFLAFNIHGFPAFTKNDWR